MSALHNPIEDYVLGNSAQEQERLKLQGRFLEKWTEQFLLSAGLEPGMSVLDFGCGMGDVALLAARLVGPSGHVTAIERDPVIIKKARERCRSEERSTNINFIHAELLNFHAERDFDAVVGRYVLFFQPDPVAAIAHAAKQVRPQGIIGFHEMDLANRIRSYPDGTLFEKMWALVTEASRRGGVWVDLGLHLTRLFLEAGLPWPAIKAEVPVGGEPGSFSYRWARRLSGLSCRALRSLAWQAPRNWIWIRLSQEWRLKLSTSKLSLSARFSLGLGLGFLSLCLVRRGRKRSNRISLGSNRSNMQNTKSAPNEQIFSIVLGFWQARALAVATQLGLSDLLAEGPLHV